VCTSTKGKDIVWARLIIALCGKYLHRQQSHVSVLKSEFGPFYSSVFIIQMTGKGEIWNLNIPTFAIIFVTPKNYISCKVKAHKRCQETLSVKLTINYFIFQKVCTNTDVIQNSTSEIS
jgi:hypothetical protein